MNNLKFEDLSEQQQDSLKSLSAMYLLKNLLMGINFGAMLVVANILLVMGFKSFAPESRTAMFVSCIAVDIGIFILMRINSKERHDVFREQVDKIVKSK